MANKTPLSAEDKKNGRIGCGIILAALLLIGGCNALTDDGSSSTSSSSSSSVSDDKLETVTVEDYTSLQLQAAQDRAQAAGIHNLDSLDYTGQSRAQLWDRNWLVCEQSPLPGSIMDTSDTLTFKVVKSSEGETCDNWTTGGNTVLGAGGDPTDTATDDASSTAGSDDQSYDDPTDSSGGTSGADDSSGSSDSSASTSGGSSSSSSSSGGDDSSSHSGATAQCNDGSYSYSQHRRGTCSHHGGVAVWLASVPS